MISAALDEAARRLRDETLNLVACLDDGACSRYDRDHIEQFHIIAVMDALAVVVYLNDPKQMLSRAMGEEVYGRENPLRR